MEEDITFRKLTWNKCKLTINILVLFVLLLLVLYICYIPFIRYHYLFTWHVVFGTIAYLVLLPYSIIIFDNIWLMSYTRKQKSLVHGILTCFATTFTLISIYYEYYRKEINKEDYHFVSSHAIIGFISFLLLFLANISGLCTFNISWFTEKIINITPVTLKLCHNIFGQTSYILGIISICIGIYTPWFIYYSTTAVRIILTLSITFVTFWTSLDSFLIGFNQIKNMTND